MNSELESLTNPAATGAAATVVMLRDGERGLEVLLAERPRDRGSFPGAWVFPGGAVDEADAAGDPIDGIEAARRAAVRETLEEVGLVLEGGELVPFSHWTPPASAPKRLTTTFFAVRVPDGELRLAPDEVEAAAWLRPEDALDRHASGGMTLWPPTWVTLHGLSHAASVDDALADLRGGSVQPFVAKIADDGELRLAPDEVVEAVWIRPEDALDRHAAGGMTLWPPTWVTLHGLSNDASVDDALADLRGGSVQPFVAKIADDGQMILWQEDDEFVAEHKREARDPSVPDDGPDADGNRHRLMMDRLPWIYINTLGAGF